MCDIKSCVRPGSIVVEHQSRGELVVCRTHATHMMTADVVVGVSGLV
jgi:hypothetical protein